MSENAIPSPPPTEENATPLERLQANAEALSLNRLTRHLFLCADQTKPKCCEKSAGLESWDYLKRRLKELGLDRPSPDRPDCLFRTKANCLRVCEAGPILLVYPDGVWYRNATPEAIERIIQDHLLGGKIVEEYAFEVRPLPLPETAGEMPASDQPDPLPTTVESASA